MIWSLSMFKILRLLNSVFSETKEKSINSLKNRIILKEEVRPMSISSWFKRAFTRGTLLLQFFRIKLIRQIFRQSLLWTHWTLFWIISTLCSFSRMSSILFSWKVEFQFILGNGPTRRISKADSINEQSTPKECLLISRLNICLCNQISRRMKLTKILNRLKRTSLFKIEPLKNYAVFSLS